MTRNCIALLKGTLVLLGTYLVCESSLSSNVSATYLCCAPHYTAPCVPLPAAPKPPRKTRGELAKYVDADYYGYRDEDDGTIVPLEQEEEKKGQVHCLSLLVGVMCVRGSISTRISLREASLPPLKIYQTSFTIHCRPLTPIHAPPYSNLFQCGPPWITF